MTLRNLSQVYHLRKEIAEDRRRIQEIEEHLLPGSPPLTSMPRSPGVKDKIGDGVTALIDLRNKLQSNELKCVTEENVLIEYINQAQDSIIRRILKFRFYDGLSWDNVADEIGGGNNANNVRHLCYDFIKRH
jgi:hypothetical protein